MMSKLSANLAKKRLAKIRAASRIVADPIAARSSCHQARLQTPAYHQNFVRARPSSCSGKRLDNAYSIVESDTVPEASIQPSARSGIGNPLPRTKPTQIGQRGRSTRDVRSLSFLPFLYPVGACDCDPGHPFVRHRDVSELAGRAGVVITDLVNRRQRRVFPRYPSPGYHPEGEYTDFLSC